MHSYEMVALEIGNDAYVSRGLNHELIPTCIAHNENILNVA